MISQDPGTSFDSWKIAARSLLENEISPGEILWGNEAGLFGETAEPVEDSTFKVPKEFVALAQSVICHRAPERWALLYQILWRIVKNGERALCAIGSDPDISKARYFEKNVHREIHKLHAFVRFKLIDTDSETSRERYVAWFEPEHDILRPGAPFFQKRFTNMDWSIFTPQTCAHWNGKQLVFTEGVASDPTGNPDSLEEAWRTYYRSIFNPARLKVKAMQAEMPKKYWKNLPEADLIAPLIAESENRVRAMSAEPLRPARPAPKNRYLTSLAERSESSKCQGPAEGQTLGEMAASANQCRGCPLWQNATGTVFGIGPENARVMIVGEQPGDREDIAGEPFVGPAGQLLRGTLQEIGLDITDLYLTNAVKHFKWTPKETPRGKLRLHQSPNVDEIAACRPWVFGELKQVAPEVLILLGASAARSLLGKAVQVTKMRGLVDAPHLAPKVILTVHPSYLLRIPEAHRDAEMHGFREDLSLARPVA